VQHEADTIVDALTPAGAQYGSTSTTPSTGGSTAVPTTGTGTAPTIDPSTIKNPLLTIDLSSAAAASLKSVGGGYLTRSGIVVAQSSAGTYVAATQTCSHEPKKNVIFNKTEFYCTVHGARFDLTGKGKNSFGSRGLTVYKTATDGKTLVVYS